MNIYSDIIYSLRLIRKDLGTSFLITMILSLGIGASILMFSVVNGTMWQKPFPDKDSELLHLRWNLPKDNKNLGSNMNAKDFQYFADHTQTMENLASYRFGDTVVHNPNGNQNAYSYKSVHTSSNFLEILGVKPTLGRIFTSDGETAEKLVVISHNVWEGQYEMEPDVVGKTIHLNGSPHTIIGIMPNGFRFPYKHHLWIPTDWGLNESKNRLDFSRVQGLGFAKKSVSTKTRQTEFDTFAKRLAVEFPETNIHYQSILIQPFNHYLLGDVSPRMFNILLFCAFGVLLVSCANVANLITGKGYQRMRELALRHVFGAKRYRIIFQFLIYSLILSSIGSFIGFLLAKWGSVWLHSHFNWSGVPNWWSFDVDIRAVALAFILAVISGIATALIPAIRASKRDNLSMIQDTSRTSSSSTMGTLSNLLVISQITLSLSLLIVATTAMMFSDKLVNRTPVFDTDSILTTAINVRQIPALDSEEKLHGFFDELKARLSQIPGVQNVGFANADGGMTAHSRQFKINGIDYENPEDMPLSQYADASIRFFETMGVAAISGRTFTELDTANSEPVAVVNQAFANSYFPNEDPVGKRIRIRDSIDWKTIIGVVPDLQLPLLYAENLRYNAMIYVPHRQGNSSWMTILLTGDGSQGNWSQSLRKHIHDLAPELALVYDPMTIGARSQSNAMKSMKVSSFAFLVFGIVSLFMGTSGLYAVINFNTKTRIHELCIRMALGANKWQVIKTVMKRALIQITIGIFIGGSIGYFLANILKSNLHFSQTPLPPIILGSMIFIVALASLIAALVPALQCSKLDPAQNLHSE